MWDHDLIAHEAPRISNMTRTSKGTLKKPATSVATSGLNRSILDAGWGVFLAILTHQTESAGRRG